MAAIQGISEDDLEDYLLERSQTFWDVIRRARKGKSVSLEKVKKRSARRVIRKNLLRHGN